MLGWCVGVVGVGLGDFAMLTPGEAEAVCTAYREAEERREREAWERSRMVAFSSVSPYLGKKRQMSPQKFMPFPWDGKSENPTPTKDSEGNKRNLALLRKLAAK